MPEIWPDDVRRMADLINLHAVCGNWGRWVAIKLHDGDSDGKLYDTRADAIRFQLHEKMCAYLLIPPDGMTYQAAASYLKSVRMIYDAGVRLTDPEGPAYMPALTQADHYRQMALLRAKARG